jgi:hypothetical protein
MNQTKTNNNADLGYAIIFLPRFKFLINAQTGATETASQAAARLLAIHSSRGPAPLRPIIIKKILVQPYFAGKASPERIATFGPHEIPDPKRLDEITRMSDLILLEFQSSETITAI